MKSAILSFILIAWSIMAFAQPGAISNIQVSQGAGENDRVVDIMFDLSGNDPYYELTMEVSFDNGGTYAPIDPGEVSGASIVTPGAGIQLVWDGRVSYAGIVNDMARIMIIATTSQCGNPITDIRDGQIYNTVLIGTQCWMAENLNVGVRIDGISDQTNNGIVEKYCYDDLESNCDIYGGLYQWDEMMDYTTQEGTQGICPPGWHAPTYADWKALTDYVRSQPEYLCNGNTSYIAKALAATTHWLTHTNTCAVGNNLAANNATGFSALPGGYRLPDGSFGELGDIGQWWSSAEINSELAWHRRMYHNVGGVLWGSGYTTGGRSLRCLKD
jgi:uncharacterized protein (TIGR02145 family)